MPDGDLPDMKDCGSIHENVDDNNDCDNASEDYSYPLDGMPNGQLPDMEDCGSIHGCSEYKTNNIDEEECNNIYQNNKRKRDLEDIQPDLYNTYDVVNMKFPINYSPFLNDTTYKYNKYLYVHQMIPDMFHSLKTQNCIHKNQYRDSLDECSFIKKAIHVDIASRMFYCFNGFEKLPHGSETSSKKADHEKVLSIIGNKESGTIIDNITIAESYNIVHNEIKVFYAGSNPISMFHNLDIDYDYWLETVLKQGDKNTSRDASTGGVAKRMTIGWGPKQHDKYPKTLYYKNIKMPYPKFPFKGLQFGYKIKPEYLKQLSDILSLSQNILDKLYDKPMNNVLRYELFGKKMGKSFDSTCKSRFEFLDIFVEHASNLNRHLDYKNDWRNGYTFGASYSYLILRNEDKKLYRVNFIMCSRYVCGAFMEEVKEVTK